MMKFVYFLEDILWKKTIFYFPKVDLLGKFAHLIFLLNRVSSCGEVDTFVCGMSCLISTETITVATTWKKNQKLAKDWASNILFLVPYFCLYCTGSYKIGLWIPVDELGRSKLSGVLIFRLIKSSYVGLIEDGMAEYECFRTTCTKLLKLSLVNWVPLSDTMTFGIPKWPNKLKKRRR